MRFSSSGDCSIELSYIGADAPFMQDLSARIAESLERIPAERLQQLAERLREGVDQPGLSAEDARHLRQLLDDYTDSVRELRAAVRLIEERLDAARLTIREGRRTAERERG